MIYLFISWAIAAQTQVDFIDGKLTQIIDLGVSRCGYEGVLLIQTNKGFRFIYDYSFFDQKDFNSYLGKNVRLWYTESTTGLTDCEAGIKKIKTKEIK